MPGLLPRFHGPGPGRQRAGRQRQLGAATGDDHGDGLPAVPGRGVAALPGHETCGENAGIWAGTTPKNWVYFSVKPLEQLRKLKKKQLGVDDQKWEVFRRSFTVTSWDFTTGQHGEMTGKMVLWNMGLLRDAWVSQRVGEWRITRWNLEKHLMHLLGDYKCDNLKVLFASKHTFIRSDLKNGDTVEICRIWFDFLNRIDKRLISDSQRLSIFYHHPTLVFLLVADGAIYMQFYGP